MSASLHPLAAADLKARLAAEGWRPSRALGQNFLLDGNLARAIVRDGEVAPGELVLEVGCGPGMLTAALLEAGARVLAVEIDAVLARLCGELLSGRGELEILAESVLSGGRIAPAVTAALGGRSFKVVSNLPYSSGTPFLCELAVSDLRWISAAVMLESGLAARLAAPPGTKSFGAPTALVGSVASVRRTRTVPASVFWPRPRVESAVLRIDPGPDAPAAAFGPGRRRELSDFLQRLFSKRRKMLRNALDLPGAEELLLRLGIDPGARPEAVTPGELVRLFDAAGRPADGANAG